MLFDAIKEMNYEAVEFQLALQCAPVISGIKLSNLLTLRREKLADLHKLLCGTELSFKVIYPDSERLVVLVYREDELESYLREERVRAYFEACGYEDVRTEGIFPVFIRRYIRYMEIKRDFPHELGLLLGYPIEDVEGFVRNDGKNFIYCGYWKVYEDVEAKLELFGAYKRARAEVMMLLSGGLSIPDIIESCKDINRKTDEAYVIYPELFVKYLIKYRNQTVVV